jgi:hypothetical protein
MGLLLKSVAVRHHFSLLSAISDTTTPSFVVLLTSPLLQDNKVCIPVRKCGLVNYFRISNFGFASSFVLYCSRFLACLIRCVLCDACEELVTWIDC